MKAWRHVHTRSTVGDLDGSGFQTVARARALAGKGSRELDDLTGQIMRASQQGGGSHARLLLQPFAADVGRCTLTRAQPLAESFDGRPGNHWVETLVVPNAWLAGLGWDLDTAFAALEWWGPERGLGEIEGRGGDPMALEAETLPHPEPGDPERPTRLGELVPDADLRHGILAAFAHQAREDKDPTEPIFLVTAADDEWRELEELLLLLPLAFPPGMRARHDADGRLRSLRLVTLGDPASLPGQDLMGIPSSLLETVRGEPGAFDLAGGVPPPRVEGEALQLARRIDQAILSGDPRRIAALHQNLEPTTNRHARQPPMTSDDEVFDPGPELLGDEVDSDRPRRNPLGRRQGQWRQRDSAEAEAGAALADAQDERTSLVADIRTAVRQQKESLQQDGDTLSQELQDAATAQHNRLKTLTRTLNSDLSTAFLNEESKLNKRIHEWSTEAKGELARKVRDLERQHQEDMEELKTFFNKALKSLEERRDQALDDLGKAAGMPGKPRKKRSDKGGSALPWFRRRSVLIALVVALAVVAGLGLWWFLSDRTTEDPAAEESSEETAAQDAATDESDSDLGQRLDAALAQRLLTAALAEPRLQNRAAQAWVLVAMDGDAPVTLSEMESCTLIQQRVRQWQIDNGEAPIAVDGLCTGANPPSATQRAIQAAAAARECDAGGWTEQAACLLADHVAPGRDDCQATWPFRLNCRWAVDHAGAFLSLVRRATTSGEAGIALGNRLDLKANPGLAEQLPALDASDSRDLLPLARLLRLAGQGAVPAGAPWQQPSDEEVEAVGAYLSNLRANLAEAATGGDAP